MSTCITNCGRPVEDALLCSGCWGEVEQALRSVSWLADELEVTITKQARTGRGIGIATRASETPILFNAEARDRKDELRCTLVGWVRVLWEHYGTGRFDAEDTLEGLASWLLRHPSWCRMHPAADELWDELRDSIRRAVAIVDLAPGRIYLAPCTADLEDGEMCREELYGRENRSTARCRACGTEWDVNARRQWMLARVHHEHANSVQLSGLLAALGVEAAPSTIRTYVQQGRLKVRSRDQRGKPQYRVGDLLEILFPTDHDLTKTAA
ncbi:hypothetical protein [Saccharopolyspora taberi]|uniref:Uncharacterized protein n=1 Tax=Saccharopolyspora taberi TaxID=60895 RepID=A0ABN3V1B7_9PSEU